jgi:hypothetical protein
MQDDMAPDIWLREEKRKNILEEFGVHKFHCEWVGDRSGSIGGSEVGSTGNTVE